MKIAGRNVSRAGLRSFLSRRRAGLASRVAGPGRPVELRETSAPYSLEQWVRRSAGRTLAPFPDLWRREDLTLAQPCKVAVLLHAFYAELVPELVAALRAVPVEVDLIVTNATGAPLSISPAGAPNVRSVRVLDVDNRGRDIWPMAQVVNAGLLDEYDLVLKVHTKRSEWRASHPDLDGTGAEWRERLLASLLGSRESVGRILSAFAENPDLGLVTAPESLKGPRYWGGNLTKTQELLRRLQLTVRERDLLFPAGSFYWVRGFVLQGLRALCLSAEDFEDEAGLIDGTIAHAVERCIGILSTEAGLSMLEQPSVPEAADAIAWHRYRRGEARTPRARIIPFYLPQFHPSPKNDQWWGTGFTEWTNVTAARPVFLGQNQPNLPADLGFYDLRLDDVRAEQAELARRHGVAGFMYYHYWFAGQRLLELPINRLAEGDVELPFCVMWANENWTRRWDGRESDILMGQDYDAMPAARFLEDVLPLLGDPRYLRIDGRPVLAVYRVGQIPDFPTVLADWRAQAKEAGVGELCVLNVDVAESYDGIGGDPRSLGLDGTLGFPPHNLKWDWISHSAHQVDRRFTGNLLSYESMVRDAESKLTRLGSSTYPGVMVNFDNTARRQWAPDVWYGANPYTFRRWLSSAVSAVSSREPDNRVVFINAWNEWAESAVLEPTRRFGRTFLQAVRDVAHG